MWIREPFPRHGETIPISSLLYRRVERIPKGTLDHDRYTPLITAIAVPIAIVEDFRGASMTAFSWIGFFTEFLARVITGVPGCTATYSSAANHSWNATYNTPHNATWDSDDSPRDATTNCAVPLTGAKSQRFTGFPPTYPNLFGPSTIPSGSRVVQRDCPAL